jgi:hypothetical protein
LGLVQLLGGSGDAKVARVASRALRELTLGHSEFLDEMLENGLLPAMSKALLGSGGAAMPSLGDTANLLHALCRLVKDSQEACTALSTPNSTLAEAVGSALLAAAAAPPPPAPDPGASVWGRRRKAPVAEDDDPAAAAAAEDAEEDDDAVEQGADLADELWQRLPGATQPVREHWARAMLPGLLSLVRNESGAFGTLRAIVNLLGCERIGGDGAAEPVDAAGDEAGGEQGEEEAEEMSVAAAGVPVYYDGPLTRAALPGVALAVAELLRANDPTSFGISSGA